MKKIHINSLLAFILLFNVSCSKWLDVKPKSKVEEEDMFSIEEGYEEALIGIYLIMGEPDVYGDNLTLSKLDILAQNYNINSSINNKDLGNFVEFKYKTDYADNLFTAIWSNQFKAIANCNNLIQNIEKETSEKVIGRGGLYKKVYGEALAIRAFLHFDLLRMFHPSYKSDNNYRAMPYIKKFSDELTKSSTTKEILKCVLDDFKKSSKLLVKGVIEFDDLESGDDVDDNIFQQNQFNYYAVIGLLARVCLYKGDKVNALKYAKEVIESNVFQFVNKNSILEMKDFTFRSEHLFSLYVANLRETSESYFPLIAQKEDDSDFLLFNEDKINKLYTDKSDLRYKYLFEKNVKINTTKRTVLKKYLFLRKKANTMSVIPIIKLAEMYLIAAECLANKNLPEAVSLLNTFQKQGRNIKNITAIFDENSLMDEISKEYQREFFGEGQLFYFYKRINKQRIKTYKNTIIEMDDEKYTFPLPKTEVIFAGRRN